nr:heavy-metal-associated domain-containing protein [Actinomycetota bacterium]
MTDNTDTITCPTPEEATPETCADANFAVTGMTCASCAMIIEKTLSKVEGVDTANVNLAAERLQVAYDPAVVKAAEIIKAVEG